MMNVLAIDVGTSSVKSAVLDAASAEPLTEPARVGISLDSPTPEAAEVPAEWLWQAVSQAAREAVARAGHSVEVSAVGLSCLMPALVLLDKNDRPLRPIWTHLDRRARPAARQVLAEVGDDFLATVGNRPLPGGISVLCFRQMLQDDPHLLHEVRWYLHANGWLALQLTGERAFDRGNACFTGLFGTLTGQVWSPRWCQYFGVDPSWLPRVACGSETLGGLRSEVAAEWKLPQNIPVKIGTADTSSAMLAARMQPGDLLHVVGTTQVLAVLTNKPTPSPRRLTRLLGVGDSFIHVAHNPVGGAALEWVRQLCFRDQSEEVFYQRSIPEAAGRATLVKLEPPFLGGDRLEIEPHRAGLSGLDLNTDRMDILAAVLASMTKGHHQALSDLGRSQEFHRVILTGGGAEAVRSLIPEYRTAQVEMLQEGSLRGVSRLFD